MIMANFACFQGFFGVELVWFFPSINHNFNNNLIPWCYIFTGGEVGITIDVPKLLSSDFLNDPKIVYEAQKVKFGSFPLLLIVVAVIVIIIFLIRRHILKNGFRKALPEFIAYGVIAVILIVLVIVPSVYTFFDAYNKVYYPYVDGEACVVEGTIYDYSATLDLDETPKYETFYINNVEFGIPGFTTPWGYPLMQGDGGIL